jgi:hypothetical protein
MASLRYHSGKMVLIPQEGGWLVRLRTKRGLIELPLTGDCLEVALCEAEQLYADACVAANGKARCQQCVHWEFVKGACGLGFPEGKRTGGHHAKDCAAFWLST